MAHCREYHHCCFEVAGRRLPCAPGPDVVVVAVAAAVAEAVDEGNQQLDDPVQRRVSHEQPYPWAVASTEAVPCSCL